MIKWLTITALLFSSLTYAQSLESLEIDIKGREDFHQVVPAGESGFILLSQLEQDSRGRDNMWQASLYNVAFEKTWTSSYKINNKFRFTYQYYNQGYLYILFTYANKKNFKLIKVNATDGSYSTKDFKAYAKLDVRQFKVFGDNVYLGGMVSNNLSLMHFNMKSNRLQTLETISSEDGHIETIEADYENDEVMVVMVNVVKQKSIVVLKKFTLEGYLKKEIKIDFQDKNLLTGNVAQVNEREYWLIGTYGQKESLASRGMFISGIIDDELQWIRFYAFNKIEGFFRYISKQDRIDFIRKFPDLVEGESVGYQYRLIPHQLVKQEDGVVLIAEACFPKYETLNQTYFDAMGLPHSVSYEIFEGWNYTHAVVMKLTSSGRDMWQESVPIEQALLPVLRKTISVNSNEHPPSIAYMQGHKINSIEISQDSLVHGQAQKIVTNIPQRQSRKPFPRDLEHWYADNFLAWGIREKQITTDKSKKVFYCDKIDLSNNGNKY